MANFEENFTSKGFKILGRFTHPQPPANPRERADAAAKAFSLPPERVVKVIALRGKDAARGDLARVALLLPSTERIDANLLAVLSRAVGADFEFYPQEQIAPAWGAGIEALTPLALNNGIPNVYVDNRLIESDTLAVGSGDALVELLVSAEELEAFLSGVLRPLDLETAKKAAKSGGTIEPRVLKGFRDYLPEEMLPRQAMIASITQVFERFGFAPLQTPALEYSDILLGKLGGDAEKLLFRFKDNGGRDVCLRYDLTVPLARVAAQYPDLPKPFKRYQIAPVWRAEKPGRGRFREFFQCDCDIVGSASLLYDAECIALDFAVMQALGLNAEVRFNNRKVLAALGTSLNVSGERQMMSIFRTIDKIPSQGKARVSELLKSDAGCGDEQVQKIMRFVEISGSNDEMLGKLSELLGDAAGAAIDELRRVKDYVSQMTGAAPAGEGSRQELKLDFSIARGLDYYTGTVYETFLTDVQGGGSVMSGGRYDGLIERYLGKPMPAVGISVGIDRLFSYLVDLGRVKKSAVTSRVMVVAMDAACLAPALGVLGQIRSAGIAAEMGIENEQKPKMDKQLSLAGKKGIPFAAILGGNEVAKGTLMLKDLATRTQEELTVAQAIERLKKR
ncbi:MAG TPA: histidine--tRNA ligase [Planctomycetota bacterium]|nr:histidine--tRNA ligase [Planctomycetota bacterium]